MTEPEECSVLPLSQFEKVTEELKYRFSEESIYWLAASLIHNYAMYQYFDLLVDYEKRINSEA